MPTLDIAGAALDPARVSRLVRDVAEAVILPRFRTLETGQIREKRPGDLVTIADEESEQRLEAGLGELLPGANVVGEEAAEHDPGVMDALSRSTPCWVIDPVDGTHNFADGKACFAVIVALVVAGEVRAGWIHDPVADRTLYAASGQGAWLDGRRLAPDPVRDVRKMRGSLGSGLRKRIEGRREQGASGLPREIVRYRCVGREYMDLAEGKLQFARYSNRLKPWDHAAGVLACREAGMTAKLMRSGAEYVPETGIVRDNLLLAPDPESWQALADLLDTP
jgi:fructose-1,6-bisphosphatase/inositol monophosphatase family enzyme